MNDCLTACANFANCTAVSYVAAGRACYVKTSIKPAGALNSAVWGAVVVSQTKGQGSVAPVPAAKAASASSATPVANAQASAATTSTSTSTSTAAKASAAPVTKAKNQKTATTKKNSTKNRRDFDLTPGATLCKVIFGFTFCY